MGAPASWSQKEGECGNGPGVELNSYLPMCACGRSEFEKMHHVQVRTAEVLPF